MKYSSMMLLTICASEVYGLRVNLDEAVNQEMTLALFKADP